MNPIKPLARFVEPQLTDARLERQLAEIRANLGRRGPRARALGALAVVGALVAISLVVLVVRATRPREIAAIQAGGEVIALADGSELVLDAHSRLRFLRADPDAVRIELDSGGVACDVTRAPSRRFELLAGGFVVRVVGTHFVVRLNDDRVSVAVERGVVEVEAPGGLSRRQLSAGETWSAAVERGPEAPVGPAPSASEAPAVSASAASSVEAPASSGQRPEGAETAKQLFERAQRARAAGRIREAREAFTALKTRFPNDPRAGLASFELARLEQDDHGDPKAAAKLLTEAAEKAPAGSALREDAEARRVQALEAAGDRAGCRAARSAFLSRYPASVNRARVLEACPTP